MSKTIPNFRFFFHILKIGVHLVLIPLGTKRVYLRITTHSGLILCDPKYKNMYFTLFCLSFMMKIIPNFRFFLYPQNRFKIGTDTFGGQRVCI